jgi:hypothetical protein
MTITDEEYELRTKLLKIQELYVSAKHPVEKEAAQEIMEQIKERLKQYTVNQEQEVETRFPVSEGWCQKLFYALCAKHGIKPYYSGQYDGSIIIKATKSMTEKLWLEHQRIQSSIHSHIDQEIDRLIKLMV